MTHIQEQFLGELKSKEIFTVAEHWALYVKYNKLAIEQEQNNGATERQAKTMGDYYVASVLDNFIGNEHKIARIMAYKEPKKKV